MRHRQPLVSLPSIKDHAVCHIFLFCLRVYGTKANHLNVITKLLIYWNNYLEWQSLARTPFSIWLFLLCSWFFPHVSVVHNELCGMQYESLQYACLHFTDDPNLFRKGTKELKGKKHSSYVHWLSWVLRAYFFVYVKMLANKAATRAIPVKRRWNESRTTQYCGKWRM